LAYDTRSAQMDQIWGARTCQRRPQGVRDDQFPA